VRRNEGEEAGLLHRCGSNPGTGEEKAYCAWAMLLVGIMFSMEE